MSYLERLKQIDGHKKSLHTPENVPPKLTKVPSVSSVSTNQGTYVKLHAANLPDYGVDPDMTTPADERIGKMVAKLKADPSLIYAMQNHDDIEPNAVILTLAIRGKGVCELRIPKSRYDDIALLGLIEKHTTREILQ